MSVLSIIVLVLVLVAVIAYFKQWSPDQRKKQAALVRDVSTMAIVATGTFAVEAGRASVKAGQLAAKTVEAEHAEAINAARESVDKVIVNNGGTVRRAGITLGSKAADAVYLTDANIAMAKALKDLDARLDANKEA